jgi:hypothetical protein
VSAPMKVTARNPFRIQCTRICESTARFWRAGVKADFPLSVAYRGETERAEAELVSGNYFETLGVN